MGFSFLPWERYTHLLTDYSAALAAQNVCLAGAIWVIAAYLVGAIPFGLLFGFMKGLDIRTKGSGNIGATNAIRLLGKPIGITAFLLDFLKGFGPTLLALRLGEPIVPAGTNPQLLALLCGAAAVLGHCYPVYLRFKGGKGVAATAGAVLALRWDAALVSFAVFFLVRAISRYVSLSSMALGAAFPLAIVILHPDDAFGSYMWITIGGILAALLIAVRHRSNIARIAKGEESKIGEPDPDRVH
jgi:acyl phosphate:glycerol-3-phosphate acyltransferase